MFLTGPDVIKEVLNEEVTMEELGGALTHNQKSGVAHMYREKRARVHPPDQAHADLPAQQQPRGPALPFSSGDDPARREEKLASDHPQRPQQALRHEARCWRWSWTAAAFFEVQPLFAPNMIIGFARLDGHVIGLVANQPRDLAGVLDINASRKGARFIRFCDCVQHPDHHLPGRARASCPARSRSGWA